MYFELEVVIAKVRLFVEFTGKGKKQKYLKTVGFPKLYYMLFTSHTQKNSIDNWVPLRLTTQFENTKQNRRYHKDPKRDPQLHLCSNHRWGMFFKTSLVLFILHIKGSYVHVICNASCWRMEIQSDLLWVLSSGHSSNSRSRQNETRYHRCSNHRDTCYSRLKTKKCTYTLKH